MENDVKLMNKIQEFYDTVEEINQYNLEISRLKEKVKIKAILVGVTVFIILFVFSIWLFTVGENLFGIIFLLLSFVGFYGPYTYIISKSGKSTREKMCQHKKSKLVSLIDSGETMDFPDINELYNKDYIAYNDRLDFTRIICNGIEKRLFYHSNAFLEYFKNKTFISKNKDGSINYLGEFEHEKLITNATLVAVDGFAVYNELPNYQFVEITRTTYPLLKEGTYIYSFDKTNNLRLVRVPYTMYQNSKNDSVIVYDGVLEEKVVEINEKNIRDFQLFGSQLMESSVSSNGILDKKPGLVSTVFSELLFGSAYTLMKNLNTAGIKTSHSVNDLRIVQLILSDNTDIELKGISIYYEFNRRLGSTKNKRENNNIVNTKSSFDSHIQENIVNENNSSYIEELKKLKELLDLDIITKDEFDERKRQILSNHK